MAVLIGERLGQQLLDRVGGVGPEPRQEQPPAAALAEQPGVDLEGRGLVGGGANLLEAGQRRGEAGIGRGRLAQPVEQAPLAAAVREVEQGLLVQAEQGALQDAREGEVVLGQEDGVAGSEPVDNRPLAGQLQPVGIDRVIVNGQTVILDGTPTGKTPGQVVRRS